jgi:hypothetical protein
MEKKSPQALFFFAKRTATQLFGSSTGFIQKSIQILNSNPQHFYPNRHFYLACLHLKSEKFKQGVDLLMKSTEEGSSLAKARLGAALIRGEYKLSKNIVRGMDLLTDSMDAPESNYIMGMHCLELNKVDEAKDFFNKGITQKWNTFWAVCQYELARLLIKEKKTFQKGLMMLYNCGKILPAAYHCLASIILSHEKKGNFFPKFTVKVGLECLHYAVLKGHIKSFVLIMSYYVLRGFINKGRQLLQKLTSTVTMTQPLFVKEYCCRHGFLLQKNIQEADKLKRCLQTRKIDKHVQLLLTSIFSKYK